MVTRLVALLQATEDTQLRLTAMKLGEIQTPVELIRSQGASKATGNEV
jgi:hypothetical protein